MKRAHCATVLAQYSPHLCTFADSLGAALEVLSLEVPRTGVGVPPRVREFYCIGVIYKVLSTACFGTTTSSQSKACLEHTPTSGCVLLPQTCEAGPRAHNYTWHS